MRICGLQKVSTIDYPGEICCVVFLKGCNFRCGFCYNPELVLGCKVEGGGLKDEGFSEGYVLDFLKSRVGKLDAVCITGGEPLMSLDFDFVRRIREMGYKIKIDTNGSFPSRLKEMIDEGLVDYIAMDVKSCKEDYSRVTGVDVDLSAIEKSMKIVYEFGSGESCESCVVGRENGRSEFRTTVVSRYHNSENLVEMARWVCEVCGGKPGRFFLQGFKGGKEMVDSSFGSEVSVSEEVLLEMREAVDEYFEFVDIRV